jgi:hypothetical protein
LEVILTHLTDPDEKELVKEELSKRYYNHYLGIIKSPEDQPPTEAPPAPEDTARPAGAEGPGQEKPDVSETEPVQPAESLPLTEDLAGIPEVTPIKLKLPAFGGPVAEPGEQKGSEKPAKRKFCFIATAAYGSPLAPEVTMLQDFRDHHLACHALGEKFIQAYYRISPCLAWLISKNKVLKLLTRSLLTPIIFLIKKTRP